MKKALLSMMTGALAVCLLASCEPEQISPTKKENPVLRSDPPAGGGPEGGKVAPKKADTLIIK